MSTSGDVQCIGEFMKHVGDIMSTSGDNDAGGGYHEYIGVFNIN